MKIGAMNHPRKNLLKEIEWMGQNNFDFIDLTYEPPSSDNLDLPEIKKKLKQYHLEVIGHTTPNLPAIYPIEAVRKVCLEELKKGAEFFEILNVTKMNIHPFSYSIHPSNEEKIKENNEILHQMAKFCRHLGLELMLENYFTPFANIADFQRTLKEIPELKIHLDIAHANLLDIPLDKLIDDFFKSFGPKIIHLHIHDNHGINDEHLPLGCGNIDWPKIIQIIKSNHYDDTITLEVFCGDDDYLRLSKIKLEKIWNDS